MEMRKYYPTVVLSDIHLGSGNSKTEEVTRFLRSINCDRLILNGDIIDGWSLQRTGLGKWKAKHSEFIKVLMKMMEQFNTSIIYVRGNHDDFIDGFAPLHFSRISIVKEYIYESHGKRYFVTHGDLFDAVTTKMTWIAKLGDVGYTLLLLMNRWYNNRRRKQGKPYYSISQKIKFKVKSAVSYISDFETILVKFARARKCNGVICGHIHHADDKYYDDIHYLNSGDWVESLSFLTEDENGNWQIGYYSDICDANNRFIDSENRAVI